MDWLNKTLKYLLGDNYVISHNSKTKITMGLGSNIHRQTYETNLVSQGRDKAKHRNPRKSIKHNSAYPTAPDPALTPSYLKHYIPDYEPVSVQINDII